MNTYFSLRDFSNVIALLAIWLFFAIVAPTFVSPRNLSNLSVELAITAVLALGMFLIILPGEIDLAAGSGVGLFGAMAAVLAYHHQWSAPLALVATLAVAILIWGLMGTLIVKEKLPSFIITLAGLLIFKGWHWRVIENKTVPIAVGGDRTLYSLLTTWFLPPVPSFVLAAGIVAALAFAQLKNRRRRLEGELPVDPTDIAYSKMLIAAQIILLFVICANQYQGIPLPALILGATAFVIYMFTRHTPFGRHLYAIGGNAEAAAISGIPVQRTIITTFAIAGSIVCLTGFMQTAYNGNSTSTVGAEMELDAVAACVIGGTSLRGGRGTIAGVLFGALIMASLLNGMTLLAVDPEKKLMARGIVLAAAVWMDERMKRD
jgi:D-xylose transport system permease protein